MNKWLRIYESYIFELRIKTLMKVILAVMCTTQAVVKIRLLTKIRFLSTNAMLRGANGGLKRYLREISSKGGSDETNNKPKEKKMQNKNVVFQ